MTFPTVTEITPQMEAVTPDPFIAGEWQRRTDDVRDAIARSRAPRAVAG